MRIPLYIKTDNSLLTSMISVDSLIDFALKNDIKALTITDNNMFGCIEFYNKCLKNNIKPIIGLEVEYKDKIILYAENYEGYKNLLKLTTISSKDKITIDDLVKNSSNLVCILKDKTLLNELNKIYKDIFVIENIKEILYLKEEDKKYIKYLHAIKDGIKVDDIEKEYNNHLVLLDESEQIEKLCDLKLPDKQSLIPKYKCPDNLTSKEYLKKLCIEGLKNKFGESVSKKYVDRLKYELDVIDEMGFNDYFLIVYDYVKYAKENDILVGPGRGSAASSLVSYLLNIITIDPLKYNLLFERFLNKMRKTMPDIDIDFEDNKRNEVINYCINKYGAKKVAPIITFGTLGARQILRDIGKTSNVNVDYLCKLIDSRLTLKENLNNKKIDEYLNINQDIKKVYQISMHLEGLKRHTSIHASGVIMSEIDLDDIIPLYYHDNIYLTGYTMEYLEDLGLLKMDFLGLSNLTYIHNILKEVNLSFDDIPLNDKEALKIFYDVNTVGIFQFESKGMCNFLNKLKPNSFDDIVSALAMYRPGPMDNIDTFVNRKKGKEKIEYIVKELEPILNSTYGIIVYQEQIILIANVLANYSLGEADILRRAMSKKKEDILLQEKDKFVKRSVENGYKEEDAIKVYDLILKFANYGFNKAHSVAYAVIAYKMAYLKAHYPLLFMKQLLSMVIGNEEKTKEYIYECKKNNIKILPPSINLSEESYIIYNNSIVFPFSNIKNIGISNVKTILNERSKGKFKDIFDFIKRCKLSKNVLESLIDSSCFEEFKINKKTLHSNLDELINYSEIGELIIDELKPELKEEEEYSLNELLNLELYTFGFYLTNHPVTQYKNKYNSLDLNKLENYLNRNIDIVVYVDKIKEVDTKKNEKMLFITGSDEISNIDLTLFPKTYQKYSNINKGNILLVNGKIEKRFDKIQVIVNDIKTLE